MQIYGEKMAKNHKFSQITLSHAVTYRLPSYICLLVSSFNFKVFDFLFLQLTYPNMNVDIIPMRYIQINVYVFKIPTHREHSHALKMLQIEHG